MQNNLTFVGAAHLSVVAFQATNQLRIPATALVATLVLGQDIGDRILGADEGAQRGQTPKFPVF